MIDNLSEPEVIRNINCKVKRYDLINSLIKVNKFKRYLEIGVFKGDNIRRINVDHKDGVDPGAENYQIPEANYAMTSDMFFEQCPPDVMYDIIFIDGLHHEEQVNKDIKNALQHLNDKGYILLHDCNPVSFMAQKIPRETSAWNGDVWRSIVKLRCTEPNLEVSVVDTDFGVGVVKRGSQNIYNKASLETCREWEYFEANKVDILNLISVKEFKDKYIDVERNKFFRKLF